MSPLAYILARNDDGDIVKYVIGAIVAFVWVIGAIASAVNKKAKETQGARRRLNQPPAATARNLSSMVGNFPPPVPAAGGRVNPKQKQKQRARQQKRQAVAVVAPPEPVAQAAAYEPQAAAETGAARSRRAAAAAAPANQIARLLRRRDSLRAALILNEVIAPPLSLRDRRDRGGAASDARSA